ncbi:MAG: DtxR family transcriptional regulator, Mn-dependent transcriptional regulator [Actinomycetota bacterium]|jgi:DtxR family Mn-dependent transcriptional regulator|nr:DtxR family transcriptional regulator, Mn-dependent transcriptional regulator [Actinomycetota bacterium]
MLATTSSAVQDYLKGLYALGEGAGRTEPVTTTAIASQLSVSAASATNMLKKLDGMGLVDHIPYRGVQLTESGRKIALEVLRHHRLLETYLAEALGVPWDQVHAEAEVLEHHLSEELEERIAARLGNPTADPHGHPIPPRDLTSPPPPARTLWDTPDGEVATVGSVSDSDPEALRYLGELGVGPGTHARVNRRGPVGGPLFVAFDSTDEEQAISKELAEVIWVA